MVCELHVFMESETEGYYDMITFHVSADTSDSEIIARGVRTMEGFYPGFAALPQQLLKQV